MEYEVDLRKYIRVLVRFWYWVVGLAAVAALVTFLAGVLLPKMYQAKAILIVQRVRTQASFISAIRTQEEDWTRRADLETYLESLTALVDSAAVANQAAEQLASEFGEAAPTASTLKEMITVKNDSGLIAVTARTGSPEWAARAANAWAKQAAIHVNAAYGQPIEEDQLVVIRERLDVAEADYLESQSLLEAFLAESRIPELSAEIEVYRGLLAQDQQTLINASSAAQRLSTDAAESTLSSQYDALLSARRVLQDAQTLQLEIAQPASTDGTEWARALTFIALQGRAFGGEQNQVQVVLGEDAPEVTPQDVSRLIVSLEAEIADLEAAIQQSESLVLDSLDKPQPAEISLDQHLLTLTQEVMALEAELESEQADLRELTRARDLAWETYEAIARKVAETEFSTQVSGSDVRVASVAQVPSNPVSSNQLLNMGVAAALGFAIGVVGLLGMTYWREELAGTFAGETTSSEST